MIKTNFSVLMAERGLKIADVYEATGISKTTLMALSENTGKGVQFDTVDKLCNYLGVELKDFFIYVPYLWDLTFQEKGEDDNSSYIVVKLKTKNTEKDYFLTVWYLNPKNYDFPLADESIKLWISIYLDDRDAYDSKDFYNFLGDLPISMSTAFYSQLLDLLKTNVLKKGTSVPARNDFHWGSDDKKWAEDITIDKGDKVYISFFGSDNKKLETTKILTI